MTNEEWLIDRRQVKPLPECNPHLFLLLGILGGRLETTHVSFRWVCHCSIGGVSPFLCFDANCKDIAFAPFPARTRNTPFIVLPDVSMRILFPAAFLSQPERIQIIVLSSLMDCTMLRALVADPDCIHQVHLPSHAVELMELIGHSTVIRCVLMEDKLDVEGVQSVQLVYGKSVDLETEKEERVQLALQYPEENSKTVKRKGVTEWRRVKHVGDHFEASDLFVAVPDDEEKRQEELVRRLRSSGFDDAVVEKSSIWIPSKKIRIEKKEDQLFVESEGSYDEKVHRSIRKSLCSLFPVFYKHVTLCLSLLSRVS